MDKIGTLISGVPATTITFSKCTFDTPKIESILLSNCNYATSITLAGSKFPTTTTMSSLLGNAQKLQTLDLSGVSMSKITSLPLLVEGTYNASGIAINLSGAVLPEVTRTSGFAATWQYRNKNTDDGANYGLYNYVKELNLSSVSAPKLTSFNTAGSPTRPSYGDNLTFDGPHTYLLQSIDLSGFDAPSLQGFGSAFNYCPDLRTVKFDGAKLPALVTFQLAFSGLQKLQSVDFSTATIASRDLNFYAAFQNCAALTSVKFPKAAALKTISQGSGAFNGCHALTNLDLSMFLSVQGTGCFCTWMGNLCL